MWDCQDCARLTGAEPHAKETSHRAKAITSSDQRRQYTLRPNRGFGPRKFLHGLTACVASLAQQPFLRLDSVIAHLPSCLEWVFPDPNSALPFEHPTPDHVMGPSVSTLATCSQLLPSVVQHQSVGAKGQSMRHRSIARQCDQGQNVSFATKSRGESCPDPNPIPCPSARVFLHSQ